MKMVEVGHLEDTQAALQRIAALVDMLREYTEPNAAKRNSAFHHEFETLTLNLHNLHELLFTLNEDIGKAIIAAYRAGG